MHGHNSSAMDRADLLRHSLAQAQDLRATGPTTDAYLRWRDEADEILADLLGPEHAVRRDFRLAVGPFDPLDAEGLQISGPDGLRSRLQRGADVLRTVLGQHG